MFAKAKELDDKTVLRRIEAFGDKPIAMIAYDVCYHKPCMNRYMKLTNLPNSSNVPEDLYGTSLISLGEMIDKPLFNESSVFLLKTMRDKYRVLFRDNGVSNWESYRSSQLKKHLQMHYREKNSFLPREGGSDFVCSSQLAIGDVLVKVKELQESPQQVDEHMVMKTAHMLRGAIKSLKSSIQQPLEDLLNISTEAARKLIPDILLRFTCQLLSDKKLDSNSDLDLMLGNDVDRAQQMAQQLMYSIGNLKTPLSVGMAFDSYNRTRSNTQMSLMNHLDQSISYDTFHRILTSIYNDVINTIQEKGIYIPPNMRCDTFTLFALDNIDWHEKNMRWNNIPCYKCNHGTATK